MSSKIIQITISILFLFSCGSGKIILGNVEVDSKARHQESVLSVKSWITVGSTKKVDFYAAKNALEKVLFEGIPMSAVKRPLYNGDRNDPKVKSYFDTLLKDPYTFVTPGTYAAADRIKTSSGYRIGVICTIRYKSIIKKLEEDSIIKKFGQ